MKRFDFEGGSKILRALDRERSIKLDTKKADAKSIRLKNPAPKASKHRNKLDGVFD